MQQKSYKITKMWQLFIEKQQKHNNMVKLNMFLMLFWCFNGVRHGEAVTAGAAHLRKGGVATQLQTWLEMQVMY